MAHSATPRAHITSFSTVKGETPASSSSTASGSTRWSIIGQLNHIKLLSFCFGILHLLLSVILKNNLNVCDIFKTWSKSTSYCRGEQRIDGTTVAALLSGFLDALPYTSIIHLQMLFLPLSVVIVGDVVVHQAELHLLSVEDVFFLDRQISY